MKRSIIISAFLLLLPITLGAQKKDYTSEQIRAAYEGTWKYENRQTQEIFTLELMYKPFFVDAKGSIPYFIGFYSYSKSGRVLVDNLSIANTFSNLNNLENISRDLELSIPIKGFVGFCKEDIYFLFTDKHLGKIFADFQITTDSMDSSNTKIYWDLNNKSQLKEVPKECILHPKEKEGCSIPMKMTLIRVK